MDSHRQELARGLDAALNRLTEALRTVEDCVRFEFSWAATARRWKELRTRVGNLRRQVEASWGSLAQWRDVAGDSGAPSTNPHHPKRADVADVCQANMARARESARSVEEMLRTFDEAAWAREAESIRYEVYREEATLVRLLPGSRSLAAVRLYVLVTGSLAAAPIVETTAAAIRGGAQMIQLREKEMCRRELLPLARELRELTAELGALFIMNDAVEIAALVGADGVHQGQDDLPVAECRKILGPEALVGISTHEPDQAARAEQDGADYIGVGPVFATQTKEHRRAVGLEYIRTAQEACSLPGYAIGSVNRETLPTVLDAGAQRVAVCTGIIAAPDIEATARWFRDQLEFLDHQTDGAE